MEPNQILHSSFLDIIFSGRNKAYGAYDLRKTYSRRMLLALSGTIFIIFLFFVVKALATKTDNKMHENTWVIDDNNVNSLPPKEPEPLPPPPPPAKAIPKMATVQFSNIKVVNNDEVIMPPPDIEQLRKARIDVSTHEGLTGVDIIAPPSEEKSTQILFQPSNKKDAEDSITIRVDVQASFPGGDRAWIKYVQRSVESELDEFTESDYGTCIVRFVVDKRGNVSDVQATTMRGSKLAEIAVNAIRKGPKWIPAQQNGHYVNAYRLQPITLKNPNQ